MRKRYFESMVLPEPGNIQKAQKELDYRLYPENRPEKVQRLHDSVQSITYRLQALELAYDRMNRESSGFPESLVPLCRQMEDSLQLLFEGWASLEPGDAFERQRGPLQKLSRNLRQQLDTLATDGDRAPLSDELLASLYTLFGSLRGLIGAMAHAQGVINQINWQQWATPRF